MKIEVTEITSAPVVTGTGDGLCLEKYQGIPRTMLTYHLTDVMPDDVETDHLLGEIVDYFYMGESL